MSLELLEHAALTSDGWQRVCGLLEPFLRGDCEGFQYLSEEGAVK